MSTVWITRAEPGASATAARVRALGWEALVAPLIEIHPLQPEIDLAGVGALAFTSAAGVAAFARLAPERGLPVFAVGEATARAAREAGFGEVIAADGDVAALAAEIRRRPIDGALLHPGASELAGEIPGARVLGVYETVAAALPAGFAIADVDAVLLHSPKAARLLAALGPPASLIAFCLSRNVAAPLAALGLPVRVASEPTEEALLGLLPGPGEVF